MSVDSQRLRCKRCHYPVGLGHKGALKHFVAGSQKSCGIPPTVDDVEPLPGSTLSCNVCKQELPPNRFYRNRTHARRKHGYTCKDCARKRSNLEQRRRSLREHIQRYPERRAARSKSQYVKRKSNCERCGSRERLHRHHPDYSKPMEIVTLCQPCHSAEHHKQAEQIL